MIQTGKIHTGMIQTGRIHTGMIPVMIPPDRRTQTTSMIPTEPSFTHF